MKVHLIFLFLSTLVVIANAFNGDNNPEASAEKLNFAKRIIRSVDEFAANEDDEDFKISEEVIVYPTVQEITCDVVQSSTEFAKVQFEVIHPQSIRYMEGAKIDVMIYNKDKSRESIDVEITMPNDCQGCLLNFYNNKCSLPEINKPKIINIPKGTARYVSFEIRTKASITDLPEFINFKLKAKLDQNYECTLTKPIELKPVNVRMFEIHPYSFNLSPSKLPKIFQTISDQKFTRFSAEITKHRSSSSQTDFTVTLTNDNDFSEVVHVTDENSENPVEVTFPENTKTVKISTKGSGSAGVTIITEKSVLLTKIYSKFKFYVVPLSLNSGNEKSVRVCATYQPEEDDLSTLYNVIYDVEMPSGYVYKGFIDRHENSKIKLVQPRWKKSYVQIYFKDFNSNEQYCFDLQATKVKDVPDSVNAVATIYDYNDKQNMAVVYYNFLDDCGRF